MIDLSLWFVFILVFIRMTSFFVSSPIFSLRNIPNGVKIGTGLMISLILFPQLPTGNITIPDHLMYFIGFAVSETLTGLIFGLAANCIFSAVRIAGQYLDIQIGFAMAMIVDPANGMQNTLVAQFFYLLGVLMFFSLDLHHVLISALVTSFDLVPPGDLLINDHVILSVIKIFVLMFSFALRMALPVILVLVISDISLGLISKTVPQFNVMMIGFPLKIGVGIMTLFLLTPVLGTLIGSLLQTMGDQILLLIRGN
ncbi:MAG: flagellar biosynthetic protein FliR [Dehalobacterium sp.]